MEARTPTASTASALGSGSGEAPKGSELELLVVAPEEGQRAELARALSSLARVRVAAPAALAKPGAWMDAAGVVAVLAAKSGSGLQGLAPLEELPAARNLLLLVEPGETARIEEALARFDPVHVLPFPTPAPLLHHAVRRLLPAESCGRGAIAGQRRARALLGMSSAIREVIEQIRRIAPSRLPVLVLGETGTGKELVARAIHAGSPRARGPFVAINCSAFPETLLESELFGFDRGAFTGADRPKRGLFEHASGGTLFLDEIGDTAIGLQPKLLRAIEEQEIRPLGSTRSVPIDVRIVSATNRNLEEAVRDGSFRQDLFYRLNPVQIHLPPLRRRRVDIPFLAQHFAEEFGESHARRITLGEDFLDALARYHFPGNVRELRNAVERAIALTRAGEVVSARHLEGLERGSTPDPIPAEGTLRERIERLEVHAIREALARFGGNRTRAAQALGLSRLGLRQKMRRLGLEAPRR